MPRRAAGMGDVGSGGGVHPATGIGAGGAGTPGDCERPYAGGGAMGAYSAAGRP